MNRRIRNVFQDTQISGFLISMLIFGIASGLYSGALNNYLAEVLTISPLIRGVIEFMRELPGLLLLFFLALLHRFSETRIIRLALLVSLMGMGGLLLFAGGPVIPAVLMITLWSTGEHLVMPARDSISVHASRPGKEGMAMGLTRSFSNIGMVAGYYLVSLLFLLSRKVFGLELPTRQYRLVFAAAGLTCLLGLIFSSRLGGLQARVKRRKFYLHRKYSRYYILEIFSGARKQVFLTFAPYVLILKYGAPTELVATLYGIYSLANIFMNPVMGRLVDRFGYRAVLIMDYTILTGLCLLYGFSHRLFSFPVAYAVVSVVFILDAMLFSAGIARTVYVRTLSADQSELTSTLSSGISINHLVSILIALLGGLIWEGLGIEILFSLSAVFGLGGLIFSLVLPRPGSRAPLT